MIRRQSISAHRGTPLPLGGWPGCPAVGDGPCHWCPGDPPVQTGNHITNSVVWDNNACHTYWYVYFGQGNVAPKIFEGEAPPERLRTVGWPAWTGPR